ncbi:MAG: type II secretion system GspH family protein [Heliobacteriaceae bacterium]|jgi:prepilin-type N-terminal cleavage/methylation domain-containing protein|nr:type II secretion system GspH family protein [Heliobacteriaceae bacterium]
MKKSAFTLSEILIALTVLGVLIAITMPTVVSTIPSKNKAMIKKAYYTAENVVSELINDTTLYPDKTDKCTSADFDAASCRYGFDDAAAGTYEGASYTIANKFQKLFAAQLNITKYETDPSIFVTTDGLRWDLTKATPTQWTTPANAASVPSTGYIVVDVNGSSEGPNCCQGSNSTAGCTGTTTGCAKNCTGNDVNKFDRFCIEVKSNGKMNINSADTKAIEIITANSKLTN